MKEVKCFRSLLGFSFVMTITPFLASIISFFLFVYEKETFGISVLIIAIASLLFAIVGGIFALCKWSSPIYIYDDKIEQKQWGTLVSIKYDEIEKVEINKNRLRFSDWYRLIIYAHNQKIEMSLWAEFDYLREKCKNPIFIDYIKQKEKDYDWLMSKRS